MAVETARARNWGWLFPGLWCGLILLASSVPDVSTPGVFFARDKLIHVVEYGVLGAFVAMALLESVSWRPLLRAVAAVAICAAVALLDETYQSTVPGRSAEVLDFLADGIGASVAQVFVLSSRSRKGAS